MLYLTRKIGESIIINNDIEMKVIEVRGKTVKLGFSFPKEASILRKELHDKITEQNIAATQGFDFLEMEAHFGSDDSTEKKQSDEGDNNGS